MSRTYDNCKFAKKNQTCDKCKNISKGAKDKSAKSTAKPKKPKKNGEDTTPQGTFGARLGEIAKRLGFDITRDRIWRKKYAIGGSGIATTHIMVEPGITGKQPRIEYFSFIIQRAVGINEIFREIMPPDAASDCELIASELGEQDIIRPQVGMEKCDSCGSMTDEFGVDTKKGKILCVKPNGCFKKKFSNAGAEALTE